METGLAFKNIIKYNPEDINNCPFSHSKSCLYFSCLYTRNQNLQECFVMVHLQFNATVCNSGTDQEGEDLYFLEPLYPRLYYFVSPSP